MTPRIEIAMWACTVFIAAAAMVVWRDSADPVTATHTNRAAAAIESPDTSRIQRSARTVIAADPFRLTREPAPLPFRPFSDRLQAPSVAQAPRPILVLRGIVGGPPWEAVIEGLPGRSGAVVVRNGEKLGDFVIRAIKKDTVVVQGMDTTWRLAMVRTWQ